MKHKHTQPVSQASVPVIPFTGECVTVGKYQDILTEAYLVKIENGIVVEINTLTNSPNVPASSIGRATQFLWQLIRKPSEAKALTSGKV